MVKSFLAFAMRVPLEVPSAHAFDQFHGAGRRPYFALVNHIGEDVARRFLGFCRVDARQIVGLATRGAPPRHQSLAAAVDWSYRLLSEAEQRLFARLSVFAGGFDADAAHGVCGTRSIDDTLDLLIGLVDKSMVTVLATEGRTRYRVLESLRAYGRERLVAAGEETAGARRHAAWFAELAGEIGAGLHGPHERAWVERGMPDHDAISRTSSRRRLCR